MIMNTGLNLEREKLETDGTEWEFGAASPDCVFAVDFEKRSLALPQGELQRGKEDFQDCVTRAYLNILETKLSYNYRIGFIKKENRDWLLENGYVTIRDTIPYVELSDRFIAILSGTTRTGNSLKAPAHAIHEYGLIPKSLLPKGNMTWDEYHNPLSITEDMKKLGDEFLERFPINYEKVPIDDLNTLLKRDMATVGVFAWPSVVNGEYPRVEYPFTHAVMAFGLPETYIFDNYPETSSDKREWVKKLASDYRYFEYGYRVYVSGDILPVDRISVTVSILTSIVNLYKQVVALFLKQQEKKTVARERLHEKAKEWLGKDARPQKLAPQDLGCVEALSTVIGSFDPSFPTITYTPKLKEYLDMSKKYRQVLAYQPGCIIVSPTVPDQFVGHTGVVGENEVIYSNNSRTGLWDDYYTLKTWIERYREMGGLKIYFYQPV